jgi:hypothetical protein
VVISSETMSVERDCAIGAENVGSAMDCVASFCPTRTFSVAAPDARPGTATRPSIRKLAGGVGGGRRNALSANDGDPCTFACRSGALDAVIHAKAPPATSAAASVHFLSPISIPWCAAPAASADGCSLR